VTNRGTERRRAVTRRWTGVNEFYKRTRETAFPATGPRPGTKITKTTKTTKTFFVIVVIFVREQGT
jgi:hypothetical protein